ncbi:MAG: tetratricopeptide repeat protein [Chitinophagales bacterium]
MKTMKSILSIIAIALTMTVMAQDDPMTNIQPIVDAAAKNCSGPVWGVDSAKTAMNYSLYREDFKQKNYTAAMKGWKYVFYNAPKVRQTTHLNGVTMYEALAKEVGKEAPEYVGYTDTVLAIYEVRANCFGLTADLQMRKAFAWYTYRNKGNEALVYDMFTETVNLYEKDDKKNSISSAFLTPWILMAIKAHKTAKVIEADEVLAVFEQIGEIADHNMAAGNDVGKYKGASDKVYEYMEKYGYLDCESIIPMAEKKYNANPDDVATAIKVYKMLKGSKCYDAPFFITVAEKVFANQPNAALAKFLSKKYAAEGDYTKAIDLALQGVELEEDTEQKALQTLNVADMYRKKGDFSSSRSYAYKAAELKTGWGAPYIMIGRLYASSGSRCGSGTGWESQVVVWPAIDMWSKAKSIDASSATEAQNLINQYSQYMPAKSDIFFKQLSVGSSYTVPCWIGATTTVRSSD